MSRVGQIQSGFAELAKTFIKGEVSEIVKEDDHYPDVPFRDSLYMKAQEVGFLALLLSEEAGGVGETPKTLTEVLYVMSKTDASVAAVILCQAFAHSLLAKAEKESLAEDVGFIASTIYDDPFDLPDTVTALKEGKSFALSGSLEGMALAPVASAYLLPAVLEGSTALFLVKGNGGVSTSEPIVTLGLRACPMAGLTLQGAEGILVAEGEAAMDAYRRAVDDLRGVVVAIQAGIIAGCFEEAVPYAKERWQGFKQIIDHEQVRAELGRIAACMLACEEMFRCASEGQEDKKASPAALQFLAGEMAVESTLLGVQILGGNGYMEDFGQEKRLRDAKQVQGIFGRKDLILQDLARELIV
jgi:alkylation response protein AidB-like acyl-CoA dehydrogenase